MRFGALYIAGVVLLVLSGTALIIFGALIFTNVAALDLVTGSFSLLIVGILVVMLLAALLLINEAPSDREWPPSIVKLR